MSDAERRDDREAAPAAQRDPWSPPAIISLVFAIVAPVSFICAAVAIAMGHTARYRGRRIAPEERGQALAVWGLALGYLGLVAQTAYWVLVFGGWLDPPFS